MTRLRRSLVVLAAAAASIGVACLDVSSPISGITSISRIIAPTPSVVEGDTLRDTTGAASRLRVLVFGSKGTPVQDAVIRYFVIDSTHKLHVDSVTGLLWGDSLSPNAAVFARVMPASGKGSLDTPIDTIPVVPTPLSATRDTNFVFAFDPTASDSNSASLISAPFGLTVKGNADTPVQKYLVGFKLVYSPPARAGDVGPTLVLISALSTNDSTYAITDAQGHAAVRLRIRLHALSGLTDSAVVAMQVRYKDTLLPILGSDTIVISIQPKLP